jgi:hypothetical protein
MLRHCSCVKLHWQAALVPKCSSSGSSSSSGSPAWTSLAVTKVMQLQLDCLAACCSCTNDQVQWQQQQQFSLKAPLATQLGTAGSRQLGSKAAYCSCYRPTGRSVQQQVHTPRRPSPHSP